MAMHRMYFQTDLLYPTGLVKGDDTTLSSDGHQLLAGRVEVVYDVQTTKF